MPPIRILIVDDHAIVRDGLNTMLNRQDDFTVVGEAGDGREAAILAKRLSPDVILMDLRMPVMSGVEAMRAIGAENPEIKTIALTTFDTDEYIFDAIEAGAKGYLLKDASREDLFSAVRTVYRGESHIEPGVAAKLLNRFKDMSRAGAPDALSERELEVLQLIARGASNRDIAGELFIRETTVKTHVANIFQKMGVSHRTEAVTQALRRGIIRL